MSQTKSSYCGDCDGEGISPVAGLVMEATMTKALKKLRLHVFVGIFIFRSKIRRDHQVPSSLPLPLPYVPVPPSPVSSDQLPRTSSTQSQCAIDIPSDNESKGDDQESLTNSVVKIVKERNLHSLQEFGGIQQVALVLGSDLETGIAGGQGSRLLISNPVRRTSKGYICNFLEACKSSTVFLLLVSAGLSFAIEIMEQGPQYGWHDGVAILVAVFVLITFHSVSNFYHERKLEKNSFEVDVVRNSETEQINVSDLFVGDLVHLKKGVTVPADGLYVKGDTLVLDEVLNSRVDPDGNPFLSYGSKVTRGEGHMLVVFRAATSESDVDPKERTFLESRIQKPSCYAENLCLFVSVLISLIVVIRLLSSRQHKNDDILPDLKGNTKMEVLIKIFESMFWRPRGRICILTGVLTAIVIGITQGMSFVVTVSLSYWNEKVELCGVKPQNLTACGTMGLVTVICVNTTDDLICNQMEVNEFLIGGEDVNNDLFSETNLVVREALFQGIGVLPEMPVSPTDHLLAAWAKPKWGKDMEISGQCFSVLDRGRLRSNKNCRRTVIKKKRDGVLYLHLKGDASTTLNLCSHYYNTSGTSNALEDQRSNFVQVIKEMESKGLRAIALACKQIENPESSEENSHLLALVGLKLSYQGAVKDLDKAGVRFMLVSQDELSAVRDIAHELGIVRPDSSNVELESEQIRSLTDSTERKKKIKQAIVIGSCLSEDMLDKVKSLQQNDDHVVAFFGGLTSMDIPALEEATLGITKENHSTEMARENSDIILSYKSSLASLYEVVKYGRCAYNNIQKFTQLQLTAVISGLLINLVAAICLWDSPLTAIQLIWVNFVMCLLGGKMMVMELRIEELMANPPPSRRAKSLLKKAEWKSIATQVLSQTSVLLILHIVGPVIPSINEDICKTMVFNTFLLCQVFNQLKAVGLPSKVAAEPLFQYFWFLLTLGTVMVIQVVVVEFGGSLAGCQRLSLVHWAASFFPVALSWGSEIAMEFISVFHSGSNGSDQQESSRRRWTPLSFVVSLLGIPFSMIFLLSLSYYFYPENAQAFRR